jgi:hypothetical protein
MKRFSLLISLVVIPFILFSQIKQNDEKISFFKQGDLSKYNISIQTEKAEITGILFLKDTNDCIMGTVVNEFGINAFDFVYNKEKQEVKLIDVISFIDKWYIKKALKEDLEALLSLNEKKDKNKEITKQEDDTIILNDKRYKIIYTLTPLIEQIDQEEDETN